MRRPWWTMTRRSPSDGGVGHRMRDHHGRELLAADDLLGEPDDLLGALGVECGGVLVKQEELGAAVGRHEEGQGLALAAREAADRVVEAVFQAHAQRPDAVAELGKSAPGDRAAEPARQAAAGGQGEVLGDREGRRGAGERVLEDPADQLRTAVLGPAADVAAGQADRAGVDRERPGDGVQGRALARTIGADHHDEAARLDRQVEALASARTSSGVPALNVLYTPRISSNAMVKRPRAGPRRLATAREQPWAARAPRTRRRP